MDHLSEMSSIKQEMEVAAFFRWQQQQAQKQLPSSARSKGISEMTRENNFQLRKNFRDSIGWTKISEELKSMEKKIGNTLDFEKFAPHAVAKKSGEPVARLHTMVKNRVPIGFGTGFLVSPSLLLTNYHVFPKAESAVGCAANFLYEHDDVGLNSGITFHLQPERFFYSFKELDFALISVSPESLEGGQSLGALGCLKLIETAGKILELQPVNIIQYPSGGYKEYAYKNNLLRNIILPEGFLQYDTDTLGGSSGSPVFNEFWELVGLHHCGIPKVKNGKIIDLNGEQWDGNDENDVHWIANEGISISKIIEHLKMLTLPNPLHSALLNELLSTTSDPLLSFTSSNESIPTSKTIMNPLQPGQFILNFNGPTTVNFNVGTAPVATSQVDIMTADPSEVKVPEAQIRFDEDYDNRETKGYKEDFLEGHTIALPKVNSKRSGEIYPVDNEDLVLKYYHYSLVVNARRRMMMWGALNADYNKKNKKLTRKVLGTDAWRTDDRIPAMYQITRKELYDPAKNIDLGHIIRRDDSAWGDDDTEIEYANSDTFHYTNCTPQHEAFNQSSPRGYDIHGIWGELENHIVAQLKVVDNKACIFAGPVLDNANDPKANFGSGKIQYPLKFWKIIIVDTEEEGLISYGFVLDQTDVVEEFGLGMEKLPDFTDFKKQQVKISQISKLTGVDFDSKIIEVDVLSGDFSESNLSGIAFTDADEITLRRV